MANLEIGPGNYIFEIINMRHLYITSNCVFPVITIVGIIHYELGSIEITSFIT